MKKNLILTLIIVLLGTVAGMTKAKELESSKYIKVSNRYFSLNLPYSVKGKYFSKKDKDGIFIYDKASDKAGFGGFAFGIKMFEKPSDHAETPGGKKIGELVDKKGTIYDMVLLQPTDVQFDYINGEPESYDILYRSGDTVNKTISGIKKSTYYDGRGMKGEDLYKKVLQKHLTAIKEKWDSEQLEQENMSYMYNVIAQSDKKNILDKIGYAFYDANADGIDELFIGEIAQGEWKGVAYDIYTMVDRKPAHVVSGGARDRYFSCDMVFICNEYSSGANESGMLVYTIVENSVELFPQVGFKYDAYTNAKNPWFLSYNFDKNVWENVSKDAYQKRKAVFDTYNRFDYIPFSKLNLK